MKKNYLSYISKKLKVKFVYLVLLIIFTALIETLSIYTFLPLLDLLTSEKDYINNGIHKYILEYTSISSKNYSVKFGIIVLILVLIRFSTKVILLIYQSIFSRDTYIYISKNIFSSYLNRDADFFFLNDNSTLTKNLTKETINFQTATKALLTLITDSIVSIFLIISLLYVDYKLALSTFIFAGLLMGTISKVLRRKTLESGRVVEKESRAIYKIVSECLTSIREIIIYQKSGYFHDIYSRHVNDLANSSLRGFLYKVLPGVIYQNVLLLLLTFFAIYLSLNNQNLVDIIPIFVFFALALHRTAPAVTNIYQSIATLRHLKPGIDSILKDYTNVNLDKQAIISKNTINFNESIKIIDGSFSYQNTTNNLFTDLTITIKKNSFTGIIGPSGSGKTTLFNLLSMQYKLTQGKLLYDNHVINDTNKKQVLPLIGYVPQRVNILDDTIAANIAFGEDVNSHNYNIINDLLISTQLHGFVQSLPNGLSTVIGENGSKISIGQAQRIGIARALYRQPQILFLDESTSA